MNQVISLIFSGQKVGKKLQIVLVLLKILKGRKKLEDQKQKDKELMD